MAHAGEQRALYDPAAMSGSEWNGGSAPRPSGGGPSGRPVSATRVRYEERPRSAGAQEGGGGGGTHTGRSRPLSAPSRQPGRSVRASGEGRGAGGGGTALRGLPEESDSYGVYGAGADQFEVDVVDQYAMHVIGSLKAGKKLKARPTSAPAKNRVPATSSRPASSHARRPASGHPSSKASRAALTAMVKEMMLPASGGLRYLRPRTITAPPRIFSPSTAPSPSADGPIFAPVWAQLTTTLPLNHPSRGGSSGIHPGLQPELSSTSVRSSGGRPGSAMSRPGSSHSHRPGSARPTSARPGSASSSRPESRPGSAMGGRSVSPTKRGADAESGVPLGAPKNPLATKTGSTMIREVEGSFEPLISQSAIPNYDALYDPHLKSFWAKRTDIGKLMRKTGHLVDEWAPDSGIFEAAIGDEIRRLSHRPTLADGPVDTGPIAFPVPDTPPPALDGDVVSIEVSEEAVMGSTHSVAVPLSQPLLSVWLHWGKRPGAAAAPDLDLSAVCFDGKARPTETVFYRRVNSKCDALRHLGDDTDVAPGEEGEGRHDHAGGTRRMEGILVNLPRVPAGTMAVAFTVSCYTDEPSLAEAGGAEMRVCVGHGARGGGGLQGDIVRYYLTSERYNAAAPCMLVRDPRVESGWRLQTTAKVTVGSVVVELLPALQSMLRQGGLGMPYSLEIDYCTARRPTQSLRGKTSDYSNSFKAVAGAVARAFPAIRVVGNPRSGFESPRVGCFEVTLVDDSAGRTLLFSKLQTGKWPKRMENILSRIQGAMETLAPQSMPDDRSQVLVSVLDAVTRAPLPWSVVEVHALGLAAQKLVLANKAASAEANSGKRKKKKGAQEGGEKTLYRVQADGKGELHMRLPGGRYEVWGLSDGYECEYPLEMTVRPFSKHRVVAKVALLPATNKSDEGGEGEGGGASLE